jgi:adenine/guanine phosphoribosyltransferase-like PRPP-binding protein
MHEQEETMRRRRDEIVARIRAELRSVLPEVARRLTADVGALIEAIREFETKQGRRPDAKELIEALRNRVRKSPFADLEGLISTASLEQNVIAIMDMRDQIRGIAPDAVISVQRGGAFLAEVLARGVTDFPPSIVVEKKVTPRPGKEDLVQRTPNIRAEIERRMAAGQRKFVIVDFYMGGHFAEELEAMVQELHAKFPDSGLEIHPLWMRETYGYDTIGTPAPVEGRRTPRPTRAQLTEGIVFIGGVTKRIVDDPITGERQTFLRFRRESETVTLPAIRGNAENLSIIRQAQFPVGVVLGDDMDIVFDPASREPIRIFDRTGRVVQEIPVGTRDPITGEKLETTRDILIRLMQGVQFPGARESATIP